MTTTSTSLSIDSAPTRGSILIIDSKSSTATSTRLGAITSSPTMTLTKQTSSSQPTSITTLTPTSAVSGSKIILSTTADPDSSQSINSMSSQSGHHRAVVPAIVGGVVGGIVLISIAACIIFWWHKKGSSTRQTIPNHTGSVKDLPLGGRFIRPFTLSPRHTPLDLKRTGATAPDSRDVSFSTGKGADITTTSNYPVVRPLMERWQSMTEGSESRPGIIRPYTLPPLGEEGIARAWATVRFDIPVPSTTPPAPHSPPDGVPSMDHDLAREVAMLREHILRLEMEHSALHTIPLVELEPPPTYVSLDDTAT